MTKTSARNTVRGRSSSFAERERRLEDLAVEHLMLTDKIAALDAERTAIVRKFYGEGLGRVEIAQRLGIPTGQIPTRKHLTGNSDNDQPPGSTDHSSNEPEDTGPVPNENQPQP